MMAKEGKYEQKITLPPYFHRVVVPTVIQMEAVECGAACLASILAYFGKYIPLEELREACGVTRDGASLFGIVKAGERYNLLCQPFYLDLEDLYDMPLPLIAFWSFDHFVVIEGFSKDKVYLMNPAVGRVSISYEELNANFTGVVIIFDTSIGFTESGKPLSLADSALTFFRRAKIPFLFAFFTGLGLAIPQLAIPALTQIFIDNILLNHNVSWEGWFVFSMAVIMMLSLTLKLLESRILSRIYIHLSTLMSSRFLWHILRLPYTFYLQRYSGEIANRMPLNETVSKTMTTFLSHLLIDAILSLLFAITLFYYDPLVASIGISMVLGDVLLMYYLYQSRQDAYNYYQQTLGKAMGYSIATLQCIESIKATSSEVKLFAKWSGYYTKTLNALQTIGKRDAQAGTIPLFLKMLTEITVIGFGAWRVIDGSMTIGMLIAMTILMEFFIEPVTRLVNFTNITQFLKVDLARLDDVLKNPIDKTFLQNDSRENKLLHLHLPPKLSGALELKDITFGFDPNADPIIKNISFKIEPGLMLAVVGPTGSGKSTLAKIISGLVEPWSGTVHYDNLAKNEIPLSTLKQSLGVVEQEAYLFSATIKDNISFFNTFLDQVDMTQAAEDACIQDEILQRKGGYDLFLQNNGSNLSGGQRQRIEIARVLARKPSILIFDEATASLDIELEMKIIENIRKRGCTSLIIAHRLSWARFCDDIIVLDKGEIVERGTHQALIKKGGLYKSLVDKEFVAIEDVLR